MQQSRIQRNCLEYNISKPEEKEKEFITKETIVDLKDPGH
jgi:hypothetical protein